MILFILPILLTIILGGIIVKNLHRFVLIDFYGSTFVRNTDSEHIQLTVKITNNTNSDLFINSWGVSTDPHKLVSNRTFGISGYSENILNYQIFEENEIFELGSSMSDQLIAHYKEGYGDYYLHFRMTTSGNFSRTFTKSIPLQNYNLFRATEKGVIFEPDLINGGIDSSVDAPLEYIFYKIYSKQP